MELTQKGEMVSRLQAKAGQIGKILNNLEKYNHLLLDSDKKNMERRADKRNFTSVSKETTFKKPEIAAPAQQEVKETKQEDAKVDVKEEK